MEVFIPKASEAAVPKRLRFTQTMMEDFLTDPVLAAYCIMGIELDAFQACRLRYMWWMPFLIDSSGITSGKTICDFAYINLRCILLPAYHEAGVYYPVFETGKNTFWPYFTKIRHPVFQSQIGRLDDKGVEDGGKVQGAACFKVHYKNGNKMLMPAPSFMKNAATQASMRYNTLLIDEWTQVDAASTGIDDQLIGRNTAESWNKRHPIWSNHYTFTAHAETQMHPAHERYNDTTREINGIGIDGDGVPKCVRNAVVSWSYKDYSNRMTTTGKSFAERFRDENAIGRKKASKDKAKILGEVFGIWSKSGRGWFTEEAILNCVEVGRRRNVVPITRAGQEEAAILTANERQ